jgi:Ca-activated chloride channel homolog
MSGDVIMKMLRLSVVTALSLLALSLVHSSAGVVTHASAATTAPGGSAQTERDTTGRITGIITDGASKMPLEGVQVSLVGERVGTLTNAAGRYLLIDVPVGEQALRVLLPGFVQQSHTVTVTADQTTTTDFTLKASAVPSASLVVSSIAGDVRLEVERGTYGTASSSQKIRMRRGDQDSPSNEPAMYLDGVLVRKDMSNRGAPSRLNALKPGDIQSIEVREGQTASELYGAAAANGVIVITTKPESDRVDSFDREGYASVEYNRFLTAAANPRSTFAIDVDRASYSNIRRFLRNGRRPPPDAVRIEELVNYFPYDYEGPKGRHPFAVHTEVAPAPWNPDHLLVKIGIKGKIIDRASLPPSNLVFLLDVSGSMGSPDKLPLLKSALSLLIEELRPEDRIAMVVYAGAAGLVLESTPGDQKATILSALNRLSSGGSTAGGAGIQLAYEVARRNWIERGNNRVILATDGDFNVGASSEGDLRRLIEEKREEGTFLTVLGFGTGNYQDAKMEQLADRGNGNFAYIDDLTEARKVLVTEMGGTLHTIAKDVKIQVEFNKKRVKAHRLIGYENRMLAAEDFNDDRKDAGELGAGHTVTALYEIIPIGVDSELAPLAVDPLRYDGLQVTGPAALTATTNALQEWYGAVRAAAAAAIRFITRAEPELMYVKLRYKRPDSDRSILLSHAVYDDAAPASEDLLFASAVAAFGMILRGSPYSDADFDDVITWAKAGLGDDREGYRADFIGMVETARSLYR